MMRRIMSITVMMAITVMMTTMMMTCSWRWSG